MELDHRHGLGAAPRCSVFAAQDSEAEVRVTVCDHASSRRGLKSLRSPSLGLTVVAEAVDGLEALRLRPNIATWCARYRCRCSMDRCRARLKH